jgi:site-specific DNA recombinase
MSASAGLAALLNPYYSGLVNWRGLTFEGKHPPLVTSELFNRVQDVIEAHQGLERAVVPAQALLGWDVVLRPLRITTYQRDSERARRTVRVLVLQRTPQLQNGCDLPYLPAALVEDKVLRQWHTEHLAEEQAQVIRARRPRGVHQSNQRGGNEA